MLLADPKAISKARDIISTRGICLLKATEDHWAVKIQVDFSPQPQIILDNKVLMVLDRTKLICNKGIFTMIPEALKTPETKPAEASTTSRLPRKIVARIHGIKE